MSKYYYISMKDAAGKMTQGVYSVEEKNKVTFDPAVEVLYITDFSAKSKDAARDVAMNIYSADAETVNSNGTQLSYFECCIIGNALERLARRFGLLREFRENGIL